MRSQPSLQRLRISGILPPSVREERNALKIECQGKAIGRVCNYTPEPLSFDFGRILPASQGALLHVKLSVERTYRPAAEGHGCDKRDLGFALIKAEIERVTRAALARAWIHETTLGWASCAVERLLSATEHLLRRLAARFPDRPRNARNYPATRPGLSVVVAPEAGPEQLLACLQSVTAAIEKIREPVEVLVMARRPEEIFAAVRTRYGRFRWKIEQSSAPLSRSLQRAVKASGYDWVYVLAGSVILDPAALQEALRWRAPHVFAVASQAQGDDSGKTGLTGYRIVNGLIEPERRPASSIPMTLATLHADPQAALFNRQALQRIWRHQGGYRTLEFESLEWGIRAWKLGFESLSCPDSRIRNAQSPRAEAPPAGDREFDRLRFHLRNEVPGGPSLLGLWRKQRHGEHGASARLSRLRNLPACVAHRIAEGSHPFRSFPFQFVCSKHYPRAFDRERKPDLIYVSPYVVYPPAHGGAVRMHNLIQALSRRYDVHLVSDEASTYGNSSTECFKNLASVHLIDGRKEDPARQFDRVARLETHAHAALRQEVRRLCRILRPRFVEVQHIELGRLIEERQDGDTRWLLALHDVLLSDDRSSEADLCELRYIRAYDSVIVCSTEDAALLGDVPSTVVSNGVETSDLPYTPSPSEPRILFVGPFRSPINLEGIKAFLETAYPALLEKIIGLELWVVGGPGCHKQASSIPAFSQKGVRLIDYVADMKNLLANVALTINPVSGNRGSCLKVIESVAAGRVCISTREGARGFTEHGFPSLILADRVEDFEPILHRLLSEPDCRRSLEYTAPEHLQKVSWESSGAALLRVYAELEAGLRGPRSGKRATTET
ncbi:MAG: glycosyltransferase family 4 protein [Acidobacteria bacterium]|nr:glycosyltransferase family 4 protein [Acidobacteriota bacterium]